MTAEIAVYNKLAVALAADSAVTITDGNTLKINNGAEKLFALSKHHPVGLMVYGAGTLCGVPWEMIIKEYRKKLDIDAFDTVKQYADNFWDYLCNCKHLIPEDIKENHLVDILLNSVLPNMLQLIQDNEIKAHIQTHGLKPGTLDTYKIIEASFRTFIGGLGGEDFYEGFTDDDINDAYQFSLPIAEEACENIIFKEDGIDVPESMKEAMAMLFAQIICRKTPFGTNTGLVFAGYGAEEYFPSILAYDVIGFFGDKLRLSPNINKSSSGGDSGVTAYAQEDEVSAFMAGISGELQGFMFPKIQKCTNIILHEIDQKIQQSKLSDGDKKKLWSEIETFADQEWSETIDSIRNYIVENHISKVVEMIEFLPKQDLGYMAESLVNLTAFKRKISNDSETVGGPIDVAIISKGDGFIWVKRKHYFEKDLNHQYFKRV
ncbi:hypothetical protein RBA25_000937 [Cronobacter turicensis]|nr:hypothetical protein [Cronobacter turicensis]EKY3176898.1 hypothetical protein [Cronobacter turicensis]ELY3774207.1 hypothetical protein [Cronobacter dublinensis]